MKSRRGKITASIRDRWITDWKLANERSPHFVAFIKTQDIKSRGSKSRTPDFVDAGQDRDLLSTNERHFLYRLRFSNEFVWIKEQYPLLPLERAVSIAKAIDTRYPTYPYTSNVEVVMTTDFYCKTILGKEVAYSIKDKEFSKKLTPRQQLNIENKFKIEQIFWESQHVKWHLIVDTKDIFSQNLEQLFPSYSLDVPLKILRSRWLQEFASSFNQGPSIPLRALINNIAERMGLSFTDSVALFQHSLWHKLIIANLNIRLHFEKSVADFQFRMNLDDRNYASAQ